MNITLLHINGITKTLLTVGLLINSLCCLHISMCKNLKYMYNIHCTLYIMHVQHCEYLPGYPPGIPCLHGKQMV